MNLKQLIDKPPHERIPTSIGDLSLFWLSGKDQGELLSDNGRALARENPVEFVRRLTQYVCFPADRLREGQFKPDAPTLGAEQLAALDRADLEKIARTYLAHHEELYKERVEDRSHDASGTPVIRLYYGAIKHPKLEHEPDTEYLARLMLLYCEEQLQRHRRILKSIESSFSGTLAKEVEESQRLGRMLKASLAPFEQLRTAADQRLFDLDSQVRAAIEPAHQVPESRFDMSEVFEQQRLAHERPFKALGRKLDALIRWATQTADFAVKAHDVQTEVAVELKTAGNENRRYARLNARLTFIVLGLTILGLLVAAYETYQASTQGELSDKRTQGHVERVVAEMQTLGARLSSELAKGPEERAALRARVEQLEAELARRTEEDKKLRATVERQARELERLQRANQEGA